MKGDSIMPKKVLIAYATRTGTTREIAEGIGKIFIDSGIQVEITPVKKVRMLDGYDAIILGTAVRFGMLMREMVRFVRKKKTALSKYPVAAFEVCLSMKKETPEHHKTADTYLDPIRREVALLSEGHFAGKMEYAKLGFIARFIIKKMVQTPEGDFREWDMIEAWTRKLIEQLETVHTKATVIERTELVGA